MLISFPVPPKITVAPRSQEVIQNSRIVLSCAATGIPIPVVTWTLNGQPVPGKLVLPCTYLDEIVKMYNKM